MLNEITHLKSYHIVKKIKYHHLFPLSVLLLNTIFSILPFKKF